MRLNINATGANRIPFSVGVSEEADATRLAIAVVLSGGPFGVAQLDQVLEHMAGSAEFQWLRRSGRSWIIDAGVLRDVYDGLQALGWFQGQIRSGFETRYVSARGSMGNIDGGGHGLGIGGYHSLTELVFSLDSEVVADSNSVFYSWMSDRENFSNRGFILDCLSKAIRNIRKDEAIGITPALDRDTQDEAGSPDIAGTIFRKIERARAFVADVTLINSQPSGWRKWAHHALGFNLARGCPNPNVLVELGYAAGQLGWDRCLLVFNTAFGGVEQLPFDLRGRRVLPYHVAKKNDRTAARESFIPLLQSKITESLSL